MHKKLKEKGVIFAVGSGRQYHNLKARFSSIKDDMLFIAENGTYVVYHPSGFRNNNYMAIMK